MKREPLQRRLCADAPQDEVETEAERAGSPNLRDCHGIATFSEGTFSEGVALARHPRSNHT
jgi:hypothetical protein